MCTLTYLCNSQGYELLFNRDEQRSRSLAYPPKLDTNLGAIYPIDAQANGTWLAVSQSGLSLAILNYYQADKALLGASNSGLKQPHFISRGQLILGLLRDPQSCIRALLRYDLSQYRPFVLVHFPADLSARKGQVSVFSWDGFALKNQAPELPITSSSVDIEQVVCAREQAFNRIVDKQEPQLNHLKRFHFSRQNLGHQSVNMSRPDACTVSISHISVNRENVGFRYFDNMTKTNHCVTSQRT